MTNANDKKLFVVIETKEAFPSMLKTAAALGKSRIRPEQLEKLGVKEMTVEEYEAFLKEGKEAEAEVVEAVDGETEVVEENSETEAAGLDKDDILGREYPNKAEVEEATTEATPEPEEEEAEEEPEAEELAEVEPVEATPEEENTTDEPEASNEEEVADTAEEEDEEALSFESIEEFVEAMKGMSGEEVIQLAVGLELEWKENTNKGINRMRASMALREHFFPGQRRPSGPKSPWKKVPYNEIEALAKVNNVQYTVTEDEKINRMWAIHALNKAGITPPVKEKEAVESK